VSAPHVSPIIRVACRSMARIIQVFALYVVFHGHYSPGGGFQGGALLAAAIILLRIGEGRAGSERAFPSEHALLIGSLGALLYAAVGVVDLFAGGAFLDYSFSPFPGMDDAYRHYWSILIIEIGVAIAVMAILVAIFDRLMDRDPGAGDADA
jgi:multicomponent Na+:H+ antiporter subunit B